MYVRVSLNSPGTRGVNRSPCGYHQLLIPSRSKLPIDTATIGLGKLPSGKLTLENHIFLWENSLFLWPFFNSYVCLPEGILIH